jgi:aspartate/methionine/tyrosine aminotransferase
LLNILTVAGFTVFKPRGAYYIMTDISGFDFNGGRRSNSEKATNDVAFAKFLVEQVGVAVVPGSSFYGNPADGSSQVRFTFCKKESTLAAAADRLARLPDHLANFRAHA